MKEPAAVIICRLEAEREIQNLGFNPIPKEDNMKEEKPKTYQEVAEKIGLRGHTARIFVQYMMQRWPDEEVNFCEDGYAEERALCFLKGMEFCKSDLYGQAILKRLYPEVYASR